jgi:hypothetical protein
MIVMIKGTKSRTRNAMQEDKRLKENPSTPFPLLVGRRPPPGISDFSCVFVQFVEKRWMPV